MSLICATRLGSGAKSGGGAWEQPKTRIAAQKDVTQRRSTEASRRTVQLGRMESLGVTGVTKCEAGSPEAIFPGARRTVLRLGRCALRLRRHGPAGLRSHRDHAVAGRTHPALAAPPRPPPALTERTRPAQTLAESRRAGNAVFGNRRRRAPSRSARRTRQRDGARRAAARGARRDHRGRATSALSPQDDRAR